MPVLGTESLHAIKDYIDSGQITKITYNDLVSLRDQNKLRPGTRYQITDYSTTTVQRDTRSAGHLFDVIVLATSENDLSEDAWVTYHMNSDGSPDGYFAEMTIGSASWISPMPTPEEINILYKVGARYAPPDTSSDTARVITELSTIKNKQGIMVPAMFNPAPDDDETKNLWYVYAGVFPWKRWTNNAITVSYVLYDDSEEALYTGTDIIRNDLFCDIRVGNNGTPYLYKTDINNYDPTTEVDYEDEYEYVGDFEFNGTLYNKWLKWEKESDTYYSLLTNIIVVNNQFIMTPEEFRNNVKEEEAVYDMWQEYSPNTGTWGNYYHLTDHLVDAELTKLFKKVKLDAWQIKYCLDNDTTRFTWADKENGKGVIYYMKDEWNNECSYDFKNIQFKRYRVEAGSAAQYTEFSGKYVGCKDVYNRIAPMNYTIPDETDFLWIYTFNIEASSVMHDSSVEQELILNSEDGYSKTVYNNLTKAGLSSEDNESNHNHIIQLPNIIFNTMQDDGGFTGPFSNIFGNSCVNITLCANCSNNIFGDGCNSIILANNCKSNTFGDRCGNNTFGSDCSSNTLGNDCSSNTLGNSCYNNTFGNNCDNNTFGYDSIDNTFGNSCYNNTFGNACNQNKLSGSCSTNTFGNSCRTNTFGYECSTNVFGNDCFHNTFGSRCYNNSFSTSCANNTFGHSCYNNTFNSTCMNNIFGTNCGSNEFRVNCYGNTFGESCYSNTLDSGCENNTFGNLCMAIIIDIINVQSIIVDQKCQYLRITTTDTSSSDYLQNVHVHLGVSGTPESLKTLTVATRGNTFETNFKPANSVDIEV